MTDAPNCSCWITLDAEAKPVFHRATCRLHKAEPPRQGHWITLDQHQRIIREIAVELAARLEQSANHLAYATSNPVEAARNDAARFAYTTAAGMAREYAPDDARQAATVDGEVVRKEIETA